MYLFCVCVVCLKSVRATQFSDIGGIPIKHIHEEHLPKRNLESRQNHMVFPSPLPKHSMYWYMFLHSPPKLPSFVGK